MKSLPQSLTRLAALALVAAACSGPTTAQRSAALDEAEGGAGSVPAGDGPQASAVVVEPLYAPWARVLSTYVDDEGLVDYASLKDQGADELRRFVETLATFDASALSSEDEQIAFWINAYNALAVWQVVEAYPIDSVRDVGAFWGLVGGFFKRSNPVGGAQRTLDDIEHEILRARYADPRIHWALVCAAFGCPRLIRRPYQASDLDAVLAARTKEFLTQPRALQVDRDSGTVWLSRYFDWYAGDFEAEAGSVLDYVLRHAPAEAAAWIRDHRETLRVRFLEYDWTLNDQAKGPRSRRPVEAF